MHACMPMLSIAQAFDYGGRGDNFSFGSSRAFSADLDAGFIDLGKVVGIRTGFVRTGSLSPIH